MAKGKNKPQIRFNEFTDVWEQRKLGDVASNFEYGLNASAKEFDGENKYIRITDIDDESRVFLSDDITSPDTDLTSADKYKLEKGDILFARTGASVGKTYLYREKDGLVYYAGFLIRAKVNLENDAEFVFQNTLTDSYDSFIRITSQRSGQPGVNAQEYQGFSFYVPSLKEQQQIGTYFRNLDNLITLHQRKYDQMVSVKKSMLEKLFVQDGATAPQIRFGDFTAPWRQVHLGDIVIPYADPVETPHNGYERLGIRSHGKGVFHEYVEAGKELDTAHMHRVASHNLIVNITFAWEHAVAITTDSDEGKLVSHRFPQFSMSDTIYDQFLKYLILDAKFRHHLLLSSPGGAGRNRVLKVPEMLEYEMMIPEIEEQRQIASYLNSLDDLIELYRIRLEKMKNIKTACLQKMFV